MVARRWRGEGHMNYRRLSGRAAVAVVLALGGLAGARAADPVVERGRYLITIASCMYCHTPGYFLGKPDIARRFAGSDVGVEIPSVGVFYGPNLTPDKETGLGAWTDAEVAAAITSGRRPDGRQLAPIMPWRAFATLTKPDVSAIIAYLKSLPPVRNKVPGPFGPLDPPTSYVMKVVPPEVQNVAIQVGGSLAERWCAGCHDVARTPQGASAEANRAPSFKAIAVRSSTTRESLDRHLSAAHTGMPDFSLSRYERSLLIGYILSLR
ncbi:MAG: c-type cytochrome [Rhodospirillales bacterium]|nr:c-type cytochrome [Rhodospirillales bacterium]